MENIRFTRLAIEDLKAIGRYTQKVWGRVQRDTYLSKLDKAIKAITLKPGVGKKCDHIRKGYQKYHIGRHLIFYRSIDSSIGVVRILHERMDIENHLTEC